MVFCRARSLSKNNYSAKRKGISEVIATILMVMVTVVLVFFVNTMFTDIAHSAGTSTDRAIQENQKLNQKFVIPTAYCCGAYICFEIKALGTNEFDLPTEGTGYYLNDVPKRVYPWEGMIMGPNCLDNPVLAKGQSCFGKLEGPCTGDNILKVMLPWGIQNFRVISTGNGN
jgi:flagellin-like protein